MLGHALRGRCPICGERRIWDGWGKLVETCPQCGTQFETESGYFVGGLIINMAIALVAFSALLLGVFAATYPDVPWGPLLVGSVLIMVVLPLWSYPRCKTLWIWLDRTVRLDR